MTTQQKRLTTLFSPTRLLINAEESTAVPGGLAGGREWVVPRGSCQYRQQDFSQLPARRRRAAARLAVARLEPAPGSLVHIAWQQGVAHYWIWVPEADIQALGKSPRWIPESRLFAPPVMQSGARLLGLSNGVEGQIWMEGQLRASQWWPEEPDLQGWQRFLRAAGLGVESALSVPVTERMEWLDTAWGRSDGRFSFDQAMAERIGWWSITAILLFALGWQLTSLWRWDRAVEDGAVLLEDARKLAEPRLAARERAESAASGIDELLGLQQSIRSDYQLAMDVYALLPDGTQLDSWSREPRKLRVTVTSSETDSRKFILPFIELEWLMDVTATPSGKGGMLLEFELKDLAAEGVSQ